MWFDPEFLFLFLHSMSCVVQNSQAAPGHRTHICLPVLSMVISEDAARFVD